MTTDLSGKWKSPHAGGLCFWFDLNTGSQAPPTANQQACGQAESEDPYETEPINNWHFLSRRSLYRATIDEGDHTTLGRGQSSTRFQRSNTSRHRTTSPTFGVSLNGQSLTAIESSGVIALSTSVDGNLTNTSRSASRMSRSWSIRSITRPGDTAQIAS